MGKSTGCWGYSGCHSTTSLAAHLQRRCARAARALRHYLLLSQRRRVASAARDPPPPPTRHLLENLLWFVQGGRAGQQECALGALDQRDRRFGALCGALCTRYNQPTPCGRTWEGARCAARCACFLLLGAEASLAPRRHPPAAPTLQEVALVWPGACWAGEGGQEWVGGWVYMFVGRSGVAAITVTYPCATSTTPRPGFPTMPADACPAAGFPLPRVTPSSYRRSPPCTACPAPAGRWEKTGGDGVKAASRGTRAAAAW